MASFDESPRRSKLHSIIKLCVERDLVRTGHSRQAQHAVRNTRLAEAKRDGQSTGGGEMHQLLRAGRLIVGWLSLSFSLVASESQPEGLTYHRSQDGILVAEAGRPVLFYQSAEKRHEAGYARAHYIHPLHGLGGEVLTEDFPVDHLHHRGVFTAWHQLWVGNDSAGDGWELRDIAYRSSQPRVEMIEETTEPSVLVLHTHATIHSNCLRDAQGEPQAILDEQQAIHIHRAESDYRVIDIMSTFTPCVPNLRIGGSDDAKGYGGFSWRLRLPEDVLFRGHDGVVDPVTRATPVGPWIATEGSYGEDGARAGVAVFCHPSTPGQPRQWILRRQRSMQNHAFPGRNPIAFGPNDRLRLAYRLIIYRNEWSLEALRALFNDYVLP